MTDEERRLSRLTTQVRERYHEHVGAGVHPDSAITAVVLELGLSRADCEEVVWHRDALGTGGPDWVMTWGPEDTQGTVVVRPRPAGGSPDGP